MLTSDIDWVSAMVNVFSENFIDSLYEEPPLPFGTLEPRRDVSPTSEIVTGTMASTLANEEVTNSLNRLNVDVFLSRISISSDVLLHLPPRMGSSSLFYEAQAITIAAKSEVLFTM